MTKEYILGDIAVAHLTAASYDNADRTLLSSRDKKNVVVVYPTGVTGLSENLSYALYLTDRLKWNDGKDIYGLLGVTDKAKVVNKFLWGEMTQDEEILRVPDIGNSLPLLISPNFEGTDEGK